MRKNNWKEQRHDFWVYLKNPWCLTGLLIINVLGSLYGYYWYWGQLSSTPGLLWPFIPDSPLSTTLFSLVLFFMLRKKQLVILPLLACAFLVKYGLWAVAVNLHLLFIGESFTWINLMLALSHFGMALEGIIYFPLFNISRREIYLVSGILIFQDFMDYIMGLHPYLFVADQLTLALNTALVLTGIIVGFLWHQSRFLRDKTANL